MRSNRTRRLAAYRRRNGRCAQGNGDGEHAGKPSLDFHRPCENSSMSEWL